MVKVAGGACQPEEEREEHGPAGVGRGIVGGERPEDGNVAGVPKVERRVEYDGQVGGQVGQPEGHPARKEGQEGQGDGPPAAEYLELHGMAGGGGVFK